MLLAEALSLRADAQKRLAQVSARVQANARFQEGEEPSEDAATLLLEARLVNAEIERLVRLINATNARVELEPGLTIADAIASRDSLARLRNVVTSAADAAKGTEYGWRQTRTELRSVSALNVSMLRAEADALAKEFRLLDVRLQQANWTTEVVQ